MLRRRGRPGLVGTMARTAVVAGTATAVAGGVQRRQAGRAQAADQDQYEEQQAQAAPPPPAAAPAAPAGGDMMAELEKLGQMRTAGLLDDAEFAAAKAKLLS